MRRILLFLSWLSSLTVFAQSSDKAPPSLGDQFYRAEQFSKARLWYSAAVAHDSTDWRSTLLAGESLRQLFRYAEALPYYRRVYEHASRRFPEAEFYYALMLKQQQQCEEALPLFDHFIATYGSTHPLSEHAHAEKQGCYEMLVGSSDTSTITLTRLPPPLNSPAHDFAAVAYRNDSSLVLTSGRWRAPGRTIDYRSGENYTNLILVERKKGAWREKKREISRWNTAEHDGPGCFTADRTRFYFTRCPDDYCRIYVSAYDRGTWGEPTELPERVNAPRSNSKHPALSARGDTLYFASDRPPGYGGTDLWMCVKDSSGGWGVARNLGDIINTASDEIAPVYYASEDLFFFASRGPGGGGGMDLYGIPHFVSRDTLLSPKRLPYPFNSAQDDGFLSLSKRQGFLSTNRTGDFDIYQFTPDTTVTWVEQLFGTPFSPVSLRQRPPWSSSDKTLQFEIPIPTETNDIMVVHSGPEERLANGSSRFILNSDVNDITLRQLQKSSDSRMVGNLPVKSTSLSYRSDSASLVSVSTDFVPARKGEVTGLLYRTTGAEPVPTARTEVHLLDSTGNIVKITTTNELGQFHFVNLAPHVDYSVVLANRSLAFDTTYRVRDLVVKEYGEDITSVPYEILYFDFNQSALRPEARAALRDLADYFRQHPGIAIEINAFADSLGNDTYNLLLSQQRGESVFNFLLGQGVDRSALAINAQGISTALSSTNSFVSQQLNRRVEIQLIGENVSYYPRAETRILRPNVEANQLYQLDGLHFEELKQLNGWPEEQIIPLKPLRVPVLESPVLNQFFFDITHQE